MKKINTAILLVCVIFLSGCAGQIALGVADGLVAVGAIPSFKKKHPMHAVYTPNVDTEKMILKELGRPHYVEDLDNGRAVMVYKYSTTTYLFALKDNVFQESRMATTKSIEEDKNKGILKYELVKFFPCFHDTATEVKPDDSL